MYSEPKHSLTGPRLLSMLSSSFTFTSSRAIIPFWFPVQGGREACQVWSMCLAWTSAGSPLPVPITSLQPAVQTLSAVLPELHWQWWQCFIFLEKHTLTNTQGRRYVHTKKLKSGLCGSSQSTQSRHKEFHQDYGFFLGGDHKYSADKSRCHLFISMSLNNSCSADTVPHTAPAQCSIPAGRGVGGQCWVMHTSGVAWTKQWTETCQHPLWHHHASWFVCSCTINIQQWFDLLVLCSKDVEAKASSDCTEQQYSGWTMKRSLVEQACCHDRGKRGHWWLTALCFKKKDYVM